jgi:hypothetical protein
MTKVTYIRFILTLLFFCNGLNVFSQAQTIYTPDTYTAAVKKNALRYTEKEFVVRGEVEKTYEIGSSHAITLVRKTEFMPLLCVFEGKTGKESFGNIIVGDIITITGICEDSDCLINCVITDTRQPSPPEPQETVYSPEEFAAYIDDHEFDAAGKIFSVRGRIEKIGKAEGSWWRFGRIQGYMVIFRTPGGSWIRCYFSSRQRDELLEYSAGDIVTITGEYEHGEGLMHCSISK